MKCIITGVNIKVFARAVHSLAKLGEELYVEPSNDGVSFHTVNSSRSAFASFSFGVGFFGQYDAGISPNIDGEGTSKDAETCETIKCKVAMKAFLNAFKSISSVEKNVERCKITLDVTGAKLLLQLWCRHSVVRTYNLSFIECETLKALIDETVCIHRITSQSKLLGDIFVNFQPGQDEVSLSVSGSATTVRNYVDDEPDLSKVIRTELHLEAEEFDEYEIEASGGEVVFCLKELRALLTFAEPVNLPVTALFSQPGSPIIFSVENKPLYECKFVLSTLVATSGDSQAMDAVKRLTATPVTKVTVSRDQNHTITHHNNSLAANNIELNNSRLEANDGSILRDQRTSSFAKNNSTNINTPNRIPIERQTLDDTLIDEQYSNPLINRRLSRMPIKNINKNGLNHCKSHLSNVSEVSRAMSDVSCAANKSNNLRRGKSKIGLNDSVVVHNEGADDQPPSEDVELDGVGVHDSTSADRHNTTMAGHCSSPPHKKKRGHFTFKRCFNSTYDPSNMPGYDVILAEDSD